MVFGVDEKPVLVHPSPQTSLDHSGFTTDNR